MNNRKNICLVGCFQNGLDISEHLISNGIPISAFVTLNRHQAKKYKVSGYKDYKKYAIENNIIYYNCQSYDLKNKNDQKFFESNKFDLLIIGGWNRIIPKTILNTTKFAGIGIHGSDEYLPLGRGRSPMNWAIINGKKRIILHFFKLNSKADNGDILATETFQINEYDNINTLYMKYTILSKKVLTEIIPRIFSKQIVHYPQKGKPTYFKKRNPEDGNIDFLKMDLYTLYDFVRGQTRPYPGAFCYLKKKKFIIWGARPFDFVLDFHDKVLGEIVDIFDDNLIVKCKGGLLIINDYSCKIKPKRKMILGPQ